MATALPRPGDLFITPAALHKIVIRLPKEGPGPDGVSTAALRHLPRRAIVAMNRVFNGILRTGHFPEEWKRGKIITIPKAGKDPRKPENVRPITLLSHVAKTFERALLTKLRLFLTPRQEQYGFREGHSTTLQLIRVLHYLASERNCDRYTVAVFLDMEKAFDRVWHDGLIYKLIDTSLPPALTKVVANFLQRRSFCVAVDGVLSAPRPIEAGVPQGSCLSPELYAVYTDDIPTLHGHLEDWEDDVMLALYADDSAYFASSRRADLAAKRIQRVLDRLPEWLDKWRMAVNVSKTAALLTGSQRNMPDQLRLRGQAVEWNTSAISGRAYRPLIANDTTNRPRHPDESAARAKLRPILASRLPISTKIAIYKCYIRSRLTYAAPAWYALCSGLQRQRLQAQQNIALRLIAGAGWYVRNDVIARDLGVETVEEFVRRLTKRAFNRADAGPHSSLHNLAPLLDRPIRGYQLPRDLTVADIRCGRTCRPVALDNLGSRVCDGYREHLRQLTMPSWSRPMPTGANAGRPACVSANEHARHDPDRPARHGTAAAMDVRNTLVRPPSALTDAECGRCCAPTTLRTARRLPGRRGNDFCKLRTNASGCSSPTGLTTLTRA
ncbi:RNA-directed DNA polymerase from mobile element jockey [Eumeta japonica]|uniref:RNA-directed DNA polymerase from mobile element jockey n=1 Tax=Eumeta variegata TaxID=151549 RepID=A0A4C1ZXN0_EUMVA|nr:RNA-directed DNA polymerase from mobile element jockey [Eumeta japonica]